MTCIAKIKLSFNSFVSAFRPLNRRPASYKFVAGTSFAVDEFRFGALKGVTVSHRIHLD